MTKTDKRLIEDYIPIQAIGIACKEEENYKKSRFGHPFGHPHQIHKWWATRPLISCRAAVYGAMVSASQFMPQKGPEEKRPSLCRANSSKFIERLCKYPGDAKVIKEAELHILATHAARLSEELGKKVTIEDIIEGRAPRPKILDMFAGGGSIPLEGLHLGCDVYALDLNPVAYIIELCTLVYPQMYGKLDKNVKGSAKDGTWAGLADEVSYWGNEVIMQVKEDIENIYPSIPVNILKKIRSNSDTSIDDNSTPSLIPISYLWTWTVKCKKPSCGGIVPLVKQTWLCKKPGRYIALRIKADTKTKQVQFDLIEAKTETGLGFNPEEFSEGGNATCPFCGTVADSKYVREAGCAKHLDQQLMGIVCSRPGYRGRVYLSGELLEDLSTPTSTMLKKRIEDLCKQSKLSILNESIEANPRSMDTQYYGFNYWSDLFTSRQMLFLLTITSKIKDLERNQIYSSIEPDRRKAISTYLGFLVDTLADYSSILCRWKPTTEQLIQTFGRQSLPMIWDFPEANPFGGASGDAKKILEKIITVITRLSENNRSANVIRGSATSLPLPDSSFDAIITDPPYYDNVSYSNLSDFFYVWLKRVIGHYYPEHFASVATPKKSEAIAASYRHNGNKQKSRTFYENTMADSFIEAHRVLKTNGELVVVYAHKTTLGWSTLIDALRKAGFLVSEAWPLDTEMSSRQNAMDTAALASSIFLVARKRDTKETGSYEEEVRSELERIVKERVESLWEMGISGADLLIACVGAGLRAYTKFAKVEYANGAEVPAEHFLREVESLVLDNIIAQLAKISGGGKGRYSLAGIDAATRFYIFWRFTYRNLELDAGEAIIFSYGAHVELDGANGLSAGNHALVEKKKSKYKLRDYIERGEDDKLGIPREDGKPVPLIDKLHRMLWLMDNRPIELPRFLQDTKANKEQLRLVAQMLAGTGLKGGEMSNVSPGAELSSLSRLIANWKSIIDEVPLTEGQKQLDFWEKK
jgi:putative DNA methylase